MSEQFRSYGVARTYFSVIGVLGWVIIAGSIIAGFTIVANAEGYNRITIEAAGIATVVIGSFMGLMFVGLSQYWRAGVDSAEYQQQMLAVVRENLQVSKEMQMGGGDKKPTYKTTKRDASKTKSAPLKWTETTNAKGETVHQFGEHEIKMVGQKYFFDGALYDDKSAIEALIKS